MNRVLRKWIKYMIKYKTLPNYLFLFSCVWTNYLQVISVVATSCEAYVDFQPDAVCDESILLHLLEYSLSSDSNSTSKHSQLSSAYPRDLPYSFLSSPRAWRSIHCPIAPWHMMKVTSAEFEAASDLITFQLLIALSKQSRTGANVPF